MTVRIVRRVLAAALAVALGGLAVVAIIDVVAAELGSGPRVVEWNILLDDATSDRTSGDLVAPASVVAILGVALVVVALVPSGRDVMLPLEKEREHVRWFLRGHDLSTGLERVVRRRPTVDAATVRLKADAAAPSVDVEVTARGADERLAVDLTAELERELRRLHLERPLGANVLVRTPR